ncbi:hypothetical protein KHS38_20195 [Mucilaginibacter sp. Bleaf8]|uniref:hypothetical protein n=1 Tax=Mucilaginibacter sp. Bleaf8 TaxID=2834430 RepID=UPI001BD19034|nr:hypothetical protein [Mucilaginibacter sp. Bleaf8]MBS7566737.1 hypothetical protein [Mucilaginibacter sp. Bleaf8]
MASKELTADIQEIINNYGIKARECFQNKDFEGFAKWQLEKWNAIPEPKEAWEESYRIAKLFIVFYIKHAVDFDQANVWLQKLAWLDEKQQQHPGELALMRGKMLFEKKEFAGAHESFSVAYRESKGHCFGTGDEVYLDFYRNPDKYMNS